MKIRLRRMPARSRPAMLAPMTPSTKTNRTATQARLAEMMAPTRQASVAAHACTGHRR
jgi:hypothetical protein